MALKIWLPLNGNLENKGISDIEVTNNGATIDDNGKIGQCYYFNGNKQWLTLSQTFGDFYNNDWSIAVWLKPTDSTRSVILSEYSGSGASNVAVELTANRVVRVYWNGSPDINFTSAGAIPLNEWTHVAITKKNSIFNLYLNGILKQTYTYNGTLSTRTSNCKPRIGDDYRGNSANTVSYQGYMNDFRLYGHCLSTKEVKEISQGLVLHYKLNNEFISSNSLLKNGDGSLGTAYWSSATIFSSADLPAGTNAVASLQSGSYNEYISIIPDHNYTISAFVKTAGGTSGNWYPSIYPYDIDKNFIENEMTLDGFRPATLTTLTQPLNPGDTVIHAADLSAWNVASGHYGNFCAIFGYADSTGYIYPDLVYTRNVQAFGSGINEKTNINQNNNTITLNNAYTGKFCPVGTKICQSYDGSTYYYPWGNVKLENIQNWTFKTISLTPKNINRLSSAKYFKWSNYSNSGLLADIKIVDNTFNCNYIKDSSGYENDGSILGTITTEVNELDGRYLISSKFSKNADSVTILPCFSVGQTQIEMTTSIWAKTSTLNSTAPNLMSLGENSFWRFRLASASSVWWYIRVGSTQRSATYSISGKNLLDNNWHHYAVTFKNGIVVFYIDGVQIGTTDCSNTATYVTCNNAGNTWHLAGYTATSENFIGNLVDARIYATALSAEDIADLYHIPANIDNLGGIHGFEFVENDVKDSIYKNGIVSNSFNINYLVNNFAETNTTTDWTFGATNSISNGIVTLEGSGTGPSVASKTFNVGADDIVVIEIGVQLPTTSTKTSGGGIYLGTKYGQSTSVFTYNFTTNTWVAGSTSNTNPYFVISYNSTDYYHCKTYLLGSNKTINDIPIPEATNTRTLYAIKLNSDTSTNIRSGYNSGNSNMVIKLSDFKIYNLTQHGIVEIDNSAKTGLGYLQYSNFIEK